MTSVVRTLTFETHMQWDVVNESVENGNFPVKLDQ
jgi:hypothetical protein